MRNSGAPAHDFHREHLHPSGPSLSSLDFTSDYLDEKHEEYLCLRRELGRKLFEKEKDDAGPTECERKSGALGERFEEQRREVVAQEEQELRMLRM